MTQRERPILFSGSMIRAILENRKTQTRRVIKPTMTPPRVAPLRMEPWMIDGEQETDDHGLPCWAGYHPEYPGEAKWFSCPYGGVGDRLWVRETFVIESNHYTTSAAEYPPSFTDGRPTRWQSDDEYGNWWEQCHYRATDPEPELHYGDLSDPHCRWRPSIFMPRWASRITLTVTGVRVERVQDITPEDCRSEGIACLDAPRTAWRNIFSRLWNDINASRGYGWDVNPWVWCITFEVQS